MMSSVDQDFRLRAGGAREKQRHAPIGDVGVVKGGFEWFVLDQKPLCGRQRLMRFLQQFREPLLALTDIRGSRVVGAVGKPHGNVSAVQAAGNLNAVPGVLQGTLANGRIRIAEGAVLVFLILEKIGIDRAGENSVVIGKLLDVIGAARTTRAVPQYMQRYG